ncbi:MAG: hypothetical protein ACYCR4_08950 [Acidimicrobiales bacterium]
MPSTDLATVRRRPFILEPGEHLLLEPDPIQVMANFGHLVRETGLSPEDLTSCRLASLPMPVGPPRRWPGLRPEMAWLPLLWLPPHLTERKLYVVADDGFARSVPPSMAGAAGVRREEDEEWVLRVCLELTVSGLYDAESGTFLDVMDYIGIDVDSAEGRARVATWLGGAADDDLDLFSTGLELDGVIKSQTDPDWALNEAIVNYGHFVNCAWAFGSESLVDSLDDLKAALRTGEAAMDDARSLADTVCLAAAIWLVDLPIPESAASELSEGAWWLERQSEVLQYEGGPDVFIEDYVDVAIERLAETRDATLPLAKEYLGQPAS